MAIGALSNLFLRRRRRASWYQGRGGYYAGGGGLFGLVLTALSLRRYFRGRRAAGYAGSP